MEPGVMDLPQVPDLPRPPEQEGLASRKPQEVGRRTESKVKSLPSQVIRSLAVAQWTAKFDLQLPDDPGPVKRGTDIPDSRDKMGRPVTELIIGHSKTDPGVDRDRDQFFRDRVIPVRHRQDGGQQPQEQSGGRPDQPYPVSRFPDRPGGPDGSGREEKQSIGPKDDEEPEDRARRQVERKILPGGTPNQKLGEKENEKDRPGDSDQFPFIINEYPTAL